MSGNIATQSNTAKWRNSSDQQFLLLSARDNCIWKAREGYPFGFCVITTEPPTLCNIILFILIPMVRDGYYYGSVLLAVAGLVAWLTGPLWAIIPVLLAAFFLWFFRDPERVVPDDSGAVVSPGDGKVTEVASVVLNGKAHQRISIFLNVFDVHVNRSPIAGTIREVQYQTGKFLNAMNTASAEHNEQNTVTVEGNGHTVVFKQIAGLLARRIVFTRKIGDRVVRGERIGLIKFGSRVDVILDASADVEVKVGDRVKGGASILAFLNRESGELAGAATSRAQQGTR